MLGMVKIPTHLYGIASTNALIGMSRPALRYYKKLEV